MGDDDDGVSLLLHTAQHRKELLDLLHRQNGGGLVQNDDLGAVIQHLDNLQGLLFRHGHVLDLLFGVDVKPKLFGHGLDLGIAVLFQQKARLLLAHPDVVRGREHLHQLEVLMDHADPQALGLLGGVDGHGLALHEDLASVGLVNAGEHIHQRSLARAVLAQQRQDLAPAQGQVYILVGHHASEGLGNPPHFNGVFLRHGITLPLLYLQIVVGFVSGLVFPVQTGPCSGPNCKNQNRAGRLAGPVVRVFRQLRGRIRPPQRPSPGSSCCR